MRNLTSTIISAAIAAITISTAVRADDREILEVNTFTISDMITIPLVRYRLPEGGECQEYVRAVTTSTDGKAVVQKAELCGNPTWNLNGMSLATFRGGSVNIQVMTSDGSPIRGATVTVEEARPENSTPPL